VAGIFTAVYYAFFCGTGKLMFDGMKSVSVQVAGCGEIAVFYWFFAALLYIMLWFAACVEGLLYSIWLIKKGLSNAKKYRQAMFLTQFFVIFQVVIFLLCGIPWFNDIFRRVFSEGILWDIPLLFFPMLSIASVVLVILDIKKNKKDLQSENKTA
jgi:uncharacterized membrane protein YozB (DUF420 family)